MSAPVGVEVVQPLEQAKAKYTKASTTQSPPRARLSPTSCLFCWRSLGDNLMHMFTAHSFFVPDAEYLIDIQGLISYLSEKITVGNVCIYCSGKGREFRTLDESHCKIAYDSEDDRLEISDFYDFTLLPRHRHEKVQEIQSVDEVIEDDDGEEDDDGSDSDSGSDNLDQNHIRYSDNNLELILPLGARIGHRNLRRYYPQRFPGSRGKQEDPDSGAALVRRLFVDKNSVLVPRKCGFAALGAGTDVVKAYNRGEATEAGRYVCEFRDQRRQKLQGSFAAIQ
ncbi:Cytoplasmic 60S subunit biogenesis factor [Mycena sanguinolenta]|uniref:Cytoplasmic 60S subunit biogenesis factor n=1 Tax=Mycena sanguinolenta TaxID=230812 RepID=A0A8H6YM13_9AGAR|nr:Cytoplasmic 60S subunit biogenesis factor [Mycena sanguinolenta]